MTSHLPHQLIFAATLYDHLMRYQQGDGLFASPHQALITSGTALEATSKRHADIPEIAQQLLRDAKQQGWNRAILMSAIPFSDASPARLSVPRYVEAIPRQAVASELRGGQATHYAKPNQSLLRAMAPTADGYRALVANAVEQIRLGRFDKVVLSRSLSIEAQVDLPALLATLAQRNPLGYTFAFNRRLDQGQRTLVGASPELLLSKQGNHVLSNPLAGSLPRSTNQQENKRRSNDLMHSAKDRFEHALVVDAVAEALAPFCKNLQVPKAPSVLATPTMLHLSTQVHGELRDPNTSSLQLALALHPTPAVGGHPKQPAQEFIRQQEGFDRDLFTGLVGWTGLDGNGEWAVTIRCADIGERDVTVYAGAGIVDGSDPDKEFAETAAKMRTILTAMGIESAMEAQP